LPESPELPELPNQSLKALAWTSKILAILISVGIPLILRPRRGVYPIADVQLVGLAVLSLIPNRWLVFSRAFFVAVVLLTLFPFRVFFHSSAYKGTDWGLVAAGTLMACILFVPLPLSLVLSRIRFRRGDRFTYA
jgi:hypothetical protein